MKFTDRLRAAAEPIWQKIMDHPFVQQLGDGTLPLDKYQYYVCQDHAYLRDYAKVFAMGSIKSPTSDLQVRYSQEFDGINRELAMEEYHCIEKFKMTKEELLSTEVTPANYNYVNYMLRVGFLGNCTDITAVILPCAWTYYDIGKKLAEADGEGCRHEIYGPWIDMFNTKHDQCDWLIETLDILAEDMTEKQLAEVEHHFIMSVKFEYMFWNMAYYQHGWEV
ncbi:MAG: thiaminase II [Clostridiales bacterium]